MGYLGYLAFKIGLDQKVTRGVNDSRKKQLLEKQLIYIDWREKVHHVKEEEDQFTESFVDPSTPRETKISPNFNPSPYLRLSPVSCVLGLYGLVGAPSIHIILQRMDWSIVARSKSLRKVTYV